MIYLDLSQPIENRLRSAVRNPRLALRGLWREPALWGTVLLVGGSLIGVATIDRQLSTKERSVGQEYNELRAQASGFSGEVEKARELERERAALSERIAVISGVAPAPFAFVRLMDAAAAALPNNMWIDALVVDEKSSSGQLTFRIRGFSPSVGAVDDYQGRLVETGAVAAVRLTGSSSTQVHDVPLIRFELTGETGKDAAVGSKVGGSSVYSHVNGDAGQSDRDS